MLEPLYTKKKSKIWYSKYGVGKQMVSKIYVHKDYALDVVPIDVWNDAQNILHDHYPPFDFNCICYDLKKPTVVRFDEGVHFDIVDEPYVGFSATIDTVNNRYTLRYSNMIWHGKWLWVKEDYKGFNVQASWERSKEYYAKLNETPSGNYDVWQTQLRLIGMK